MPFRDADTKRFSRAPDISTQGAKSRVALNRAAQQEEAKTQAERRKAAQNRGLRNPKEKPVPGMSKPVQVNTPSGGRASISRPQANKIGADIQATREAIEQRKAAEVSAKAAANDRVNLERQALRDSVRAQQPLLGDADADRVLDLRQRSQQRFNRAEDLSGQRGPVRPGDVQRSDAYARSGFRNQQEAAELLNSPNKPQQSAAARTAAESFGRKADDLDVRIQRMEAQAADGQLPDNAQAKLDELRAKRDSLRGEQIIADADLEPSARAKKAAGEAFDNTTTGKVVNKGKETADAVVDKAREVGDAVKNAAEDVKAAAPEMKQRVKDDIEAGKEKISEYKGKAEDAVGAAKDTIKEKTSEYKGKVEDAVGAAKDTVNDRINESEVPGGEDTQGDKSRTQQAKERIDSTRRSVGEGFRNWREKRAKAKSFEGDAKGAKTAEELSDVIQNRAGNSGLSGREQNVANRRLNQINSRAAAGRAGLRGGIAAIPGMIGETYANIQEEGGVVPGLVKTGENMVDGAIGTVDSMQRTTSLRGGNSVVDALQGIGEGLLEAGDATGRAVVAGLAPVFSDTGDTTFSDRFRGMEGRSPLGQLAQKSVMDREARLASPGGGGLISPSASLAAPDAQPPAQPPAQSPELPPPTTPEEALTQAVAPNPVTESVNTQNPNTTQVGDTDFNRSLGADGRMTYADGQGNSMTGFRRNNTGGTVNVVDNSRYMESLRNANAIRAEAIKNQRARGAGRGATVAAAGSGQSPSQWESSIARKNLMRSRPDYDNRLTPKQNNARLANWQAEYNSEMVARGLNPKTGEDNSGSIDSAANLRNQIAAMDFERKLGKDQFDRQMKLLDFESKTEKQSNDIISEAMVGLASGDDAQMSAVIDQGMLALQQFGPEHPLARLVQQHFNTFQSRGDAPGIFGTLIGREGTGAAGVDQLIPGLRNETSYLPHRWLSNNAMVRNSTGARTYYDKDDPYERKLYEFNALSQGFRQ
jgi:hypothetical protein